VIQVTVRKATPDDAGALADLRLAGLSESGRADDLDRGAFVDAFSGWLREHQSTHQPFLAHVGIEVVGMAWLMVAERVPGPAALRRRCGDVQAVYVVPWMRSGGIGALLLDAVLAEAAGLRLEHVTVHSSERAVRFYQRTGFQHDQRWLRWEPPHRPGE
jgi:GNAT superfamily N-acetyltransferase